ncbi:MAG: sterol desaturase family protein [Flavisolibacter sp.]|nr:sterol desaturase family protein [Flavisolibacter sp.]
MDILNKLLAIDINYIVAALIVIFYLLENLFETQFKFDKMRVHLFHNIMIQLSIILGGLVTAAVIVTAVEWLHKNHVGLFHYIQMPVWLKLALGVVAFDFINYWFHRTAHRIPVLWRFHRVHHSDSRMDASTNLRAHPVELLVYFGLSNIVAAALFGLDLTALGLYFLIIIPYVFLEHSNIRFPDWIDKTIGLVFVTPNIHKVHHERDQYYTDSNYSDIFIIWDRIFGTFKFKPPGEINLGLNEFADDRKQTFWYLLISPFINMGRVSSEKSQKTKWKQNQLKGEKTAEQVRACSWETIKEK